MRMGQELLLVVQIDRERGKRCETLGRNIERSWPISRCKKTDKPCAALMGRILLIRSRSTFGVVETGESKKWHWRRLSTSSVEVAILLRVSCRYLLAMWLVAM